MLIQSFCHVVLAFDVRTSSSPFILCSKMAKKKVVDIRLLLTSRSRHVFALSLTRWATTERPIPCRRTLIPPSKIVSSAAHVTTEAKQRWGLQRRYSYGHGTEQKYGRLKILVAPRGVGMRSGWSLPTTAITDFVLLWLCVRIAGVCV